MKHKHLLVEIQKDLEEKCQYYKAVCPEKHCHGYGIIYENHHIHGMAKYVCVPYVVGLYAKQKMR